jgi:hypothetical protein
VPSGCGLVVGAISVRSGATIRLRPPRRWNRMRIRTMNLLPSHLAGTGTDAAGFVAWLPAGAEVLEPALARVAHKKAEVGRIHRYAHTLAQPFLQPFDAAHQGDEISYSDFRGCTAIVRLLFRFVTVRDFENFDFSRLSAELTALLLTDARAAGLPR